MPLWHQLMNQKPLFSISENYAELEQILLFSVNWGKQVWVHVSVLLNTGTCISFT